MPKQLKHADVRREPSANNAFIGAELKLDEVISALQDLRQRHFGIDQKNWAEAGTATHIANSLVDVVNEANGFDI
jgi:hypothetical protein